MVDEVCKKVGTRWLPPRAKRDKGEEIPKEEHNPALEDCQLDEEPEVDPTLSYVEEETQSYNKKFNLGNVNPNMVRPIH